LRAANQQLVHGAAPSEVLASLENLAITRQSAVLTEKLAELDSLAGRTNEAVDALQQALKLSPSPQQRVRLMLTLGVRLAAAGRYQEASNLYRRFLKQTPDFPDQILIYRHLRDLAFKMGHEADAGNFEREVSRLAPATEVP
jgi:tetratricopeptide (TPR) repeat protein